MIELDPEDISTRRMRRLYRPKYVFKGPSYTWHKGNHDKLKLFGFSVPECIDGFSWKLICLKVGSSHKNPDLKAHYKDDHDKLKLFGFSVHVCIDAFSWKLICLKVCLSNKNPDVKAHYKDDHDKLKLFGFSVHGCIDAFPWNLICLKVG